MPEDVSQMRENALRQILHVISSSRDDEKPVFDAILENALRLCDAPFGGVFLYNEGRTHFQPVASRGARTDWLETFRDNPPPADPSKSMMEQAAVERGPVQIDDLKDTDLYRRGEVSRVAVVDVEGMRTAVTVPMFNGEECVGVICLYRRVVQRFDESQIELVKTFAAQAAIAIENVRQFRELQIRLRRESANREILEVISRSRKEESPVFETILDSASRLCDAPMAGLHIANKERTSISLVAHLGLPEGALEVSDYSLPIDSPNTTATAIREGVVIHTEDLADDDLYREGEKNRVAAVDVLGARTALMVPLLSGGVGIGCIWIFRREVRPYKEDEISLLESFAAQAVIAIENTRQFRELETTNQELTKTLDQQTATSDILELIASSRTEVEPVLEAVAETACRICDAYDAVITLLDDDWLKLVAHFGPIPFDVEGIPLSKTHSTSRAVMEGRTIHIKDISAVIDEYPDAARLARRTGWRAVLAVPLMKNGAAIGAIGMRRIEPEPFTEKQIQLSQTFAAQAVIAIENVRQFRALEERTQELDTLNSELESRVQKQVGEIARMGRLKRFLSPAVADAVVMSGDENLLSSHRALIAVMFCDIRGFTAFCETAEPEETIEVLQTYHEEMGKLIADHQAGVDHRMGDGIMVIFNDPLPCDDPAGQAVELAIAMRERMTELCADWRELGHRLGFGVGISLGYATVGMVGSEGRYDYTASGTAVNLAARLCDQADNGDILLSPRAFRAVKGRATTEPAGELSLKGMQAPVDVFRVVTQDKAQC